MSDEQQQLAPFEIRGEQDPDWSLTNDQLIYMAVIHRVVRLAYEIDDMARLDRIEASTMYVALFADMPWDEAYDRYETALEGGVTFHAYNRERQLVEIDPDQAWFWTPEWQEKEREADGDIAAGRGDFVAWFTDGQE